MRCYVCDSTNTGLTQYMSDPPEVNVFIEIVVKGVTLHICDFCLNEQKEVTKEFNIEDELKESS